MEPGRRPSGRLRWSHAPPFSALSSPHLLLSVAPPPLVQLWWRFGPRLQPEPGNKIRRCSGVPDAARSKGPAPFPWETGAVSAVGSRQIALARLAAFTRWE